MSLKSLRLFWNFDLFAKTNVSLSFLKNLRKNLTFCFVPCQTSPPLNQRISFHFFFSLFSLSLSRSLFFPSLPHNFSCPLSLSLSLSFTLSLYVSMSVCLSVCSSIYLFISFFLPLHSSQQQKTKFTHH